MSNNLIPTTIKDLASRLISRGNRKRPKISLIELEHTSDTPMLDRKFEYQYWPAEISLAKPINWVSKDILGGNVPLLQWTNGGAQTITFNTTFTCDMDLLAGGASDEEVEVRLQQLANAGEGERNRDLRDVIAYFQRFGMGTYEATEKTGGAVTMAPRKVLLIIPGLGLARLLGQSEYSFLGLDALVCYVTQADPTIAASFPSGLPRILNYSFGFTQSAQFAGGIQFPQYSKVLDEAVSVRSRYRARRGI